tara:strand:+ start:51 stop:755 length:705 start_codon:yes stop_codon:yes gene_type:complete
MDFSQVFPNGEWVSAAAQIVPGLIAAGQARNAKIEYGKLKKKIDNFQRQEIINPYAQASNPYANLQVATKAAEMQVEQSDIALANTLDSIRKTGAGGATALAQAALKSKQGVAATIEQQEVQNARLAAQGERLLENQRIAGQQFVFSQKEKRETEQLNRLQAELEGQRMQQLQSREAGLKALGSGLESLAGGFAPGFSNPFANMSKREDYDPNYVAPKGGVEIGGYNITTSGKG